MQDPYGAGVRESSNQLRRSSERVALGLGYAVLPEGTAWFYHRRDMRYLHVAGLDEAQVVLAQQKAHRMREFDRFARIARRILGGIA